MKLGIIREYETTRRESIQGLSVLETELRESRSAYKNLEKQLLEEKEKSQDADKDEFEALIAELESDAPDTPVIQPRKSLSRPTEEEEKAKATPVKGNKGAPVGTKPVALFTRGASDLTQVLPSPFKPTDDQFSPPNTSQRAPQQELSSPRPADIGKALQEHIQKSQSRKSKPMSTRTKRIQSPATPDSAKKPKPSLQQLSGIRKDPELTPSAGVEEEEEPIGKHSSTAKKQRRKSKSDSEEDETQ
jgi:hypothetical protein